MPQWEDGPEPCDWVMKLVSAVCQTQLPKPTVASSLQKIQYLLSLRSTKTHRVQLLTDDNLSKRGHRVQARSESVDSLRHSVKSFKSLRSVDDLSH